MRDSKFLEFLFSSLGSLFHSYDVYKKIDRKSNKSLAELVSIRYEVPQISKKLFGLYSFEIASFFRNFFLNNFSNWFAIRVIGNFFLNLIAVCYEFFSILLHELIFSFV